ncbi:MAG TPA: flagellar motor switch protein FliG [Bryobacteraceae bacterium]|jgi:flagellar motor switch protein FliG|nr:flagellar motor switch protein FliG [Bryobacteraceae bacterium]
MAKLEVETRPEAALPPPPAPALSTHLSGARKAAVLLVTLGEETSADLLRHLTEDEVQQVSREVARVGSVPPEQAEAVLEEYYQITLAGQYVLKGGMEYAKKMLLGAFGPETAKRLLERLSKTLGAEAANFDALQKADPQQLAKFVHSEHPQTIALILSHLIPPQAASLLGSLPPNMRSDVVRRMANLDQISPEIVSRIASVIGQKIKDLGEFSRESYGGVRAVAEMLNRMDGNECEEILTNIAEDDPALAETIRQLRFVFEDFLMVDSTSMKALLAQTDRKVLTLALKGVSPELKRQFVQAMSTRGAEMLNEDIEALGAVRIKDVEAAQQQIIATARRLQAEGQLSLRGSGNDQYVV